MYQYTFPNSEYSGLKFKMYWCTLPNSECIQGFGFKMYQYTLPNSEYSSLKFKMYWCTLPNSECIHIGAPCQIVSVFKVLDLRCISTPFQIVSIQALDLRCISTPCKIVSIQALDLRCNCPLV